MFLNLLFHMPGIKTVFKIPKSIKNTQIIMVIMEQNPNHAAWQCLMPSWVSMYGQIRGMEFTKEHSSNALGTD